MVNYISYIIYARPYFTICAAMSIVGLTLFGEVESAASTIGRIISAMVGGLLITLGLRSFLNAPDPEAQPPRWMESVSSMPPPRAFGFGMALFPIQIKNLAKGATRATSLSNSFGSDRFPIPGVNGG